jgi:hypothetical protein
MTNPYLLYLFPSYPSYPFLYCDYEWVDNVGWMVQEKCASPMVLEMALVVSRVNILHSLCHEIHTVFMSFFVP